MNIERRRFAIYVCCGMRKNLRQTCTCTMAQTTMFVSAMNAFGFCVKTHSVRPKKRRMNRMRTKAHSRCASNRRHETVEDSERSTKNAKENIKLMVWHPDDGSRMVNNNVCTVALVHWFHLMNKTNNSVKVN